MFKNKKVERKMDQRYGKSNQNKNGEIAES